MKRRWLLLGWILLAPSAAWTQTYQVSWWTVDAGGVQGAVGGPFGVGATTGQPDAGGPFAGSPYLLRSGFWHPAVLQADLGITKTDGQAVAVPGQPITYTIVAANAGPSAVTGATVLDAPPLELTGASWTCAASPGSSCPASGSGAIDADVDLAVAGTATFTLTATVAPDATGSLANTASITVPAGVNDPGAGNNSATDTDTLAPEADLSLAKSDSPDPVAQGETLSYTIQVTNLGPSTSPGMTVIDTLPSEVSFVSSVPGQPACAHAGGTVSCALGALDPAASATVTIQVTVGLATGAISNTAAVTGSVADVVPANNSDSEATELLPALAEGELAHGARIQGDLAGVGPSADADVYRISQRPYASYEIVLDGTSGDIGTGSGPFLERLASDGSTVLQSAQGVGTGSSRSLRFMNATSTAIDDELIRVRSASCGSDCGPEDVYRLRVFETTGSIPRFNNSATQATIVLLQNRGAEPVSGQACFWSSGGGLLHCEPFSLPASGLFTVNTFAVPALVGQAGTVKVVHDGVHGALNGKAVALEPATGFTFDTPLQTRPR
jgi:uncharacterized repeat protein (TIGR01451 family)